MDSEILNQLTILEKNVDSEVTKPKRGRKKKADIKINELEENDIRDKRERLVACVLSGNSKTYLGKEYTEQQINEMDCTNVNTLLNRYESFLSAQMTQSLGKSIINLYSNIACSVLGIRNQQELSTDWSVGPRRPSDQSNAFVAGFLYMFVSIYLSIYLSICLSVCLSVYLYFYVSSQGSDLVSMGTISPPLRALV